MIIWTWKWEQQCGMMERWWRPLFGNSLSYVCLLWLWMGMVMSIRAAHSRITANMGSWLRKWPACGGATSDPFGMTHSGLRGVWPLAGASRSDTGRAINSPPITTRCRTGKCKNKTSLNCRGEGKFKSFRLLAKHYRWNGNCQNVAWKSLIHFPINIPFLFGGKPT